MKQKNIIMMAVAVGFGLVAALLTSQMSAKSSVETVEVMVAAKDLPVGSLLTKEDVANPKVIKWKKIPKDMVPPGIVEASDELVEKRLSRAIRAEETINRADITKGGVVTIPPGMKMSTVQLAAHQAVAGFVGPGSRVDVLATVRLGERVIALPIMVDMLVLAVNTETTYSKEGVYPGARCGHEPPPPQPGGSGHQDGHDVRHRRGHQPAAEREEPRGLHRHRERHDRVGEEDRTGGQGRDPEDRTGEGAVRPG
jgi:Flp pilus assembly protein CpaB